MVIDEQATPDANPAFEVLLLMATLTLAVAIHELGHVFAGWLLGFRFSLISVGPLSLRLEHGVSKVRVRRDMPALGYAAMRVDGVQRLRSRLLLYVAAGPAANLLSVPVAMLLTKYGSLSLNEAWVAAVAREFAAFSALLVPLSMVPYGSLGNSDGSRILMLTTSRDRARRWLATVAIGGQQHKGVRAKNWKSTWLKAASSLRDGSLDEYSGNWLAYISANAKKNTIVAEAHLERCLELSPLVRPTIRDLAAQEAGIYTAWFRNNPSQADKWFAQVKKPKLMTTMQQLRAGIALQSVHGDFVGALDSWQKGFVFIQKLPIGPQQASLMESWQEWKTRIQERQTQLVPS